MKKLNLRIFSLIWIFLIITCISVSAISDSSGDVYHYNGYDAEILWEFYGEKDNIDIIEVSKSVLGSEITLSVTIKGGIVNNEKISYYLYLYKNPTSYYAIEYSDGSGMASGNGDLAGFVETNPDFVLSTDEKTLSYTFSDVDTSIPYTVEAYAVEHDVYGNIAGEAWYDYVPESAAPYFEGQENGAKKDTPGFVVLTLISALWIISMVLKRRT